MKKLLAILLSAMITMTILAGCGKQEEKTAQTSSQTTAQETANKETVTLNILAQYNSNITKFKDGMNENKNEFVDFINEKSGYKISYEILPAEGSSEKIAVTLLSNDVPDIIVFGGKDVYSKLAMQGALTAVDEYMEKDGAQLKKIIGKDIWDAIKIDGKTYAIASLDPSQATNGVLARTDLIEKSGFGIPTTLDEYYNVMKALSDKTKKVYGITAAEIRIPGFIGAFGVGTQWIEKDGKIVPAVIQPEMKEFLSYMKKLYDEGILDMEFSMNDGDKVIEKMVSGQAAMTISSWWSAKDIIDSISEETPDAKLEFIAPPVGKNGQTGFSREVFSGLVKSYNVIPAKAAHPEDAVRYMNWLASDEAMQMLGYGVKDKHYTLNDGKYEKLPEMDNIPWRIIYQLLDTSENFANRLQLKGYFAYYEPLPKWTTLRDQMDFAPALPAFDKDYEALYDIGDENCIKFIMGERSLDEFDMFVQEFLKADGQASIDEANQWYDQYKAAK